MEPLIEPLESAGHAVIVVDLPCADADATLEQYAAAVRAVLPDDLADVVLVGHSFGGFTVSTIAAEHLGMSVVYVAAWVPRAGASVLDLFVGGDPFEDGDEDAGIAAFGGLIASAGAGLCARTSTGSSPRPIRPSRTRPGRTSSGRSVRRASPRCARSGAAICRPPAAAPTSLTTADTLVPPEAQRAMAASVGADVVEIDTGHSPFGEQPARLAELLVATTR